MFKNSKIPTTIYNSNVVVVTELVTDTITVPSASEPTASVGLLPTFFRRKRDDLQVDDDDVIESSLLPWAVDEVSSIQPTQPLLDAHPTSEADVQRLINALNHPQVRQIWNELTSVLNNVL